MNEQFSSRAAIREARFEHDLSAVLRASAPSGIPETLRRRAMEVSSTPVRGFGSVRRQGWLPNAIGRATAGMAALGASLIILVVVLLPVLADRSRTAAGLGGSGTGVRWSTPYASLEAREFAIRAVGATFVGNSAPVRVASDPGRRDYRTLEVEWRENGVEMRLNLYFAADASEWWVSEIRTYDGRDPGDWITYRGTFFKTRIGEAYEGTVDVTGGVEGSIMAPVPAADSSLHFGDARIEAFGIREPETRSRDEATASPTAVISRGTPAAGVAPIPSAAPSDTSDVLVDHDGTIAAPGNARSTRRPSCAG